MLVLACGATGSQDLSGVDNRSSSGRSQTGLPSIRLQSIDQPYIRYSERSSEQGSRGRIFYFHPVRRQRNLVVSLEHEPEAPIVGIVDNEIFGEAGPVSDSDGQIHLEFLPISLPRGVSAGQEWRMHYIDREFSCKSQAAPSAGSTRMAVSCVDAPYTFSFVYDREKGVTEFQDFCGSAVCTYELIDPVGLFSTAMLEHVGVPAIEP